MKWTEQEISKLQQLYGTMKVTEVAQILGRTRWAVLKMASTMKLDGKPIRWTAQEMEALCSLYPTTRVSEIAQLLDRPEKQIRAMAFTHRLERTQLARAESQRQHLPVGSERPNQHGQMMRKVKETGLYRQAWKRVDILTWEAVNGPVPKGKIVTTIDSARPPTADNLHLVDRAGLAKKNSPDLNYPPEVAELIHLKAAITRRVNKMAKLKAEA